MKGTVYVETSIIGYLASRPSRDLITAANQQLTREWWDRHRRKYEIFISEVVTNECRAGDPSAAKERLEMLESLQSLHASPEAMRLASKLIKEVPLPQKAAVDASHIAIAAVNGLRYLLTWNCTHIANAVLMVRINEVCRNAGFEPPLICTPQQLMES